MTEKIKARAEELRREFQQGRLRLAELEAETVRLRETLWRISGAVQVCDELLKVEEKPVEEPK